MAEASIVFRNKDMSSTGKIYVDYMDAAARLAAKYRNASHYVDAINRRDEVAYRWEGGIPAWGADIEGITAQVEAYKFERPEDPFWEPENQVFLLAEALPYAFDVAIGKEDDYAFDSLLLRTEIEGDAIWILIREAQSVEKTAGLFLDTAKWAQHILDWMQESQGLFPSYRIEYAALSISTGMSISNCRIGRLDMDLAELGLAEKN